MAAPETPCIGQPQQAAWRASVEAAAAAGVSIVIDLSGSGSGEGGWAETLWAVENGNGAVKLVLVREKHTTHGLPLRTLGLLSAPAISTLINTDPPPLDTVGLC